MNRFEYRFVTVNEGRDEVLDTAGVEGWEAVGVTPGERGLVVLLKRVLEPEQGDLDPEDGEGEDRSTEEHHARCRCGGRKHLDVVNVHVHGGCRHRHGGGK